MSTACDVFRLLSSQYKQADLMVRASYFEIYSGKVCAQLVGVLTSSLKGQQPSFYGQSPRPVIGTASVVCGAGSMKLSGVRLSACLSHLVLQPRRAAGLLLCPPGRRYRSIAVRRICSRRGRLSICIHIRAVVSSKCEQCHVYSDVGS